MAKDQQKRELSLIKKAMRGNPKAFGELIRDEQKYLYRMAFLYTRNEEDALDAVQESVLKAYTNIKKLRAPEHFRTWLTRIVINTAQNLCHQRRPGENIEDIDFLPFPENISPEERIDLYDALERLPEQYRQIIQLRYFDGLTNREIAKHLGIPEGTVASQLSRAMQRMRKELKEERIV